MSEDVASALAMLPNLNKKELLALWREHFGKSAPNGLRRNFLVPILAYRIQERALGGLSITAQKQLRELARKFAANPATGIAGMHRIKPGTRLLRDWHGQSHEVLVLDDGYGYAGQSYSNLSEIARLITGTRWSGPKFFGLKQSTKRELRDADPS